MLRGATISVAPEQRNSYMAARNGKVSNAIIFERLKQMDDKLDDIPRLFKIVTKQGEIIAAHSEAIENLKWGVRAWNALNSVGAAPALSLGLKK